MDYDSLKQAILQRISIIDIASSYTNLTPSGKNLKGKSPFTNEKTPSFYVSPEKNLYYCFSSSKGGDIFNFVQEMEGVDFKGAVAILAQKAGVDIEEFRTKSSSYTKVSPLYEVLESAKDIYKKNVNSVAEYLKGRGLSQETIKTWEIGFAKKGWDNLVKEMPGKEKILGQAGLTVQGSRGWYDRFRERIMFPFHNESGKIIGFSGRVFGEGSEAKYINSPETPLFNKSAYLFGLYFARRLMRKLDFTILVEGQFDVILSQQSGFGNTVCPSGTSVTKEQISQIQRTTNRIVIAFDTDDAGKRATTRTASLALHQGAEVKIANLPQRKDPADIIAEDVDAWKEAIRTAKEFIPFVLEEIEKRYPLVNQDRILTVKREVLPIISSIHDAMLKKHYIDIVATFCGIDIKAVEEALANKIEKEEKNVVQTKEKVHHRDRLHDIAEIYYFLQDKGFPIDETLEKKGIQALVTHVGRLPEKHGVGILRESIEQGDKTLESYHQDLKEIVREYLRNILKQELKKINEKRDKAPKADFDKSCLNIQNQLLDLDNWGNS